MTNDRAFWLAWSQVQGLGPILIRRLDKHFGTLAAAWSASAPELLEVDGIGLLTVDAIGTARSTIDPEQLLVTHERDNERFWTPADAEYPRLLLETPDPPPVLYYRGKVNVLENQGSTPAVAIVGTRSPSDYGRRWTRRITATLAQNGFVILSGLADGVDTEAHQSCLDVGGRTIAVLGCGVDVVYPWSNRRLQRQVQQQGLLVSEYPDGTPPDRTHFPRRNRIIAGWSRATVVIEAPRKSGALITAYLANDYGRDVYALPGSLDNPKAIGCILLLNKGAHPFVDEAHLLELLGAMPEFQPECQPECQPEHQPERSRAVEPVPIELPTDQAQVLQVLVELLGEAEVESVPFDRIVQKSGLPAGLISSALLQLELTGFVAQLPGMRYQRA